MTPIRIGKVAACLALLASLSAFAQEPDEQIAVSVTPSSVPEHESFQMQVEISAPLTAVVKKPVFEAPDVVVMGEPGINFTPEAGPGGPNTRKKMIFTYVLMPKRAGDLTIRNIQVSVGQANLKGTDQRITVTAGGGGPSGGEDDANPAAPGYVPGQRDAGSGSAQARGTGGKHPASFNSDFTVFAQISKLRAYVGEPLVLEYYLYDYGLLRQSEIMQWPTFNNFWKEDLELATQYRFDEVFVNNQEMRRAFIARYALFGTKPGKFYVDKLGIRGKYVSNANQSPFFGFELRRSEHYSQNVQVEIVPLPEAGRPEKFGGAVGRFTLKLEADKLSLPQNTPVNLTFSLSGTGNFHSIDSIKVPLPPDFEIYESSANARAPAPIGVKQNLEQTKKFQVVAIPRRAGTFEIPSVSWSYFDPDKEAYETLTTAPIQLEITEGRAGGGSSANTYLETREPGAPPPRDDELRYLKPVSLGEKDGIGLLAWAAWLALSLNFLAGFSWIQGRSRSLFRFVKSIDRFSEARILLLQAKGIRDSEWQAGLEEVALRVVEVLLGTSPRGLTKQELDEAWRSKSLPAPLFQKVTSLLDELDRHRFSSQKLTGADTKDLRSRLTKETESLLIEASRVRRK